MATTNYILTSNGNFISEDELYHYGIKGQKWGVRRYQNEDGSLTDLGRRLQQLNSDVSYAEADVRRTGYDAIRNRPPMSFKEFADPEMRKAYSQVMDKYFVDDLVQRSLDFAQKMKNIADDPYVDGSDRYYLENKYSEIKNRVDDASDVIEDCMLGSSEVNRAIDNLARVYSDIYMDTSDYR